MSTTRHPPRAVRHLDEEGQEWLTLDGGRTVPLADRGAPPPRVPRDLELALALASARKLQGEARELHRRWRLVGDHEGSEALLLEALQRAHRARTIEDDVQAEALQRQATATP